MNVDRFIIQQFRTSRKRLVPGDKATAKTRHHPLADAERLSKRIEGVVVLNVVADDESGEASSLAILARHGAIPAEFEEQIRAL